MVHALTEGTGLCCAGSRFSAFQHLNMGLNFNLMDQLVFYGSYHQTKGNQLIHFFFVPLIMWSVSVWLAYIGPLSDKLDLPAQLDFLPPNIAACAC